MHKVTFLIIIISFIFGIVIGSYGSSKTRSSSQPATCDAYQYINKQLGCHFEPVIQKQEYTVFKNLLRDYIQSEISTKKVANVSVYFRDLLSGPTMGIEEGDKFSPASLLKLPLLLTYANLAETNPGILEKKLAFNGSTDILEQSQSKPSTLQPNTQYSVKELLEKIIVESDNLAYVLLFNSLKELFPDENPLQQTMIDLGLVNPRTPFEDTITVKSYASLFRNLYNSSYLSSDMSEYALSLLAKSSYAGGLRKGVPKDIPIAHKYGERSGDPTDEKQLHDCGIIYFPQNPYLLCVMTRGSDFSELERVLGTISEKVYDEVSARKIK